MKTVKSDFEKLESAVTVALHPSNLSKNGMSYYKVSRHTVTLENIIASIIEKNRGVDPQVIQHSVILLQQEILSMLEMGHAVNLLDLGSLYINVDGSVNNNHPDEFDSTKFGVRFTPYKLIKDAVSRIKVGTVLTPSTNPQIDIVTDDWTKEENSSVSKGRCVVIKGQHLKIGGVENPIEFIMVDENNEEIENQKPVIVTPEKIITNYPRTLRFYVPEELTEGKRYKIKVNTRYLQKDRYRKEPVYGESVSVCVK